MTSVDWVTTEIRCDHPGCDGTITVEGSVAEARARAAEDLSGWVSVGDCDYCWREGHWPDVDTLT